MFEYFPGDYAWSSAVNLALMAGGALRDIDRWLRPLRDSGSTSVYDWADHWTAMAHHQEQQAESDLLAGHPRTAGTRYLRASVYHSTGQRLVPPGPTKSESYAATLTAFSHAVEHTPLPLQRIQIDSPDGPLPGYLIAPSTRPTPVVVMFGGFDMMKELLFAIVRDAFARQGITCLVVDTPGLGEPLRLGGVPARPDTEVIASAIFDDLATRPGLDLSRLGVLGLSLGGYQAARAAAFDPRVGACVAWGALWDWGAVWRKRWTEHGEFHMPWFQLPWAMGTTTLEQAMDRADQWTLAGTWPQVSVPLLLVHGERDRQLPVADAERAFAAAGSSDKQLRIFTQNEGGCEHAQTDDPEPARELIVDWLARQLHAVPLEPLRTAPR